MEVSILYKLQLPSFNVFEAMINMDEYEYLKENINVFVEHLWLLSFVTI